MPADPPSVPRDEKGPKTRLKNETAHRIAIDWKDHDAAPIQLPPWSDYVAEASLVERLDLEPWTTRGLVTDEPAEPKEEPASIVTQGVAVAVFVVAFWASVIFGLLELIGEPPQNYWRTAGVVLVFASILIPAFLLYEADQLSALWRPASGAVSFLTLLLTLAIAFLMPAIIILTAEGCCGGAESAEAAEGSGESAEVLVAEGTAGAGAEGPEPAEATTDATGAEAGAAEAGPGAAGPEVAGAAEATEAGAPNLVARTAGWIAGEVRERPMHALGRGLQLLLIGILSVLPALLYYLFDRRKLAGLRQRFFQSVVRLDPDLRTLSDARRVHGVRADEALGPASDDGKGPRMQLSRQVVILVSTVVVAVGWIVALNPVGATPAGGDDSFFAFIQPVNDPLVFAFLGGYAFALWMLLRRYFRSDLKPEAYAHVVARIVVAVLITWVIAELPLMMATAEGAEAGAELPSGFLLALAFFVGWLPETGLFVIREALRTRVVGPVLPEVSERLPLERLDGIDLYTRARFMDEGIENLENLAHCDLIDLMLRTRIPLETLLDWIDQAILVLHVRGNAEGEADLDVLRSYGIRTATDLKAAYRKAQARERPMDHPIELPDGTEAVITLAPPRGDEVERFLSMLGGAENGPPRLRVIMDTLDDDPWMPQLERNRTPHPTSVVYASFLPDWDRGEKRFLDHLWSEQGGTPARTRATIRPLTVRVGSGAPTGGAAN